MDIQLSNKIRWFEDSGKIKLSFKREDNIFTLNGLDYEMRYLDNIKGSKGGNSNVFLICDPSDTDNENEHLVVKICNKPVEISTDKYKKRYKRELIALNKVKSNSKNQFIIELFDYGNFLINNKSFPFYIMEKCNCDLTNYLDKYELNIGEKVALCYYIIQGFLDLHALKIYHRDIKSDNFLIKDEICKIGDLGLVDFRDIESEFFIDEIGERIGAFGWESPEVINKYLTEKKNNLFDCKIDTSSDIFQLGKLFWFIFQGNIPIGQIAEEDFLANDSDLFSLIYKMLQYKKGNNRRPVNIDELKTMFKPIAKRYSIV